MIKTNKNSFKVKYEISKYECTHCTEKSIYTIDDGNFVVRLCKACYEQMLTDMVSNINLAGHTAIKSYILRSERIKINNIINVSYVYDLGFRKITIMKQAKILKILNSCMGDDFCDIEIEYID